MTPSLSNQIDVYTPEDNKSNIQIASFKRRLAAFLIDYLLIYAISLLFVIVFYGTEFFTAREYQLLVADTWLFQIVNNSIPFVYLLIFWSIISSSPGKRILKLKIVDKDTKNNISKIQTIKRILFYPFGLLTFFILFFDKINKQGLHDKISKTIVIKTKGA